MQGEINMEKIITLLFILFLSTITQVNAEIIPNKIYAISSKTINKETIKEGDIITFISLKHCKIIDDIELNERAEITIKVHEYIKPKRGKKDGYLKIKVISYEDNTTKKHIDLKNRNITGSLKPSTPKDIKEIVESASVSLAGKLLKIPGFTQAFATAKGLIKPNEGQSRLKSAGQNLYESTPLTYIEEGSDIEIEPDSIVVIKVNEKKKKNKKKK